MLGAILPYNDMSPTYNLEDPESQGPLLPVQSGPALVIGVGGRSLGSRVHWYPEPRESTSENSVGKILCHLREEQTPRAGVRKCGLCGNLDTTGTFRW